IPPGRPRCRRSAASGTPGVLHERPPPCGTGVAVVASRGWGRVKKCILRVLRTGEGQDQGGVGPGSGGGEEGRGKDLPPLFLNSIRCSRLRSTAGAAPPRGSSRSSLARTPRAKSVKC